MIAHAHWPAIARVPNRASRISRLLRWSGLLLPVSGSLPAAAQVVGSISLESDQRLRGYSMSEGRPTATVDLGYDHSSGGYLNGSATVVFTPDDPAMLGYQLNAGYAARLSSGLTIDAGVVHSRYLEHFRGRPATHYSEAYVGLAMRNFVSRVYFSPDYLAPGKSTVYGEIEGTIRPAPDWRVSAKVGGLIYLSAPPRYYQSTHYDWRLSAGRRLGKLDLHLAVSGGGRDKDYYRGRARGGTAVTGGATFTF